MLGQLMKNSITPAFLNIVKVEIWNTENGLWRKSICDVLLKRKNVFTELSLYVYMYICIYA